MAFHFTELPRRSQILSETLGPSLGHGLANMMTGYFANKSLEKVLSDKNLADKPLSEKWSALESSMRNFGPIGEQILQRRIGIEQQKMQEKEQARQIKGRRALAQRFGISPEEAEGLTPEQIISSEKALTDKKKMNSRVKLGDQIYNNLIKSGYPEPMAKLWQEQFVASDSLQAQQDTLKIANDFLKRSKLGKGLIEEEGPKDTLKTTIEIPGIENKAYELDFPELIEPTGRTSADVIKEEAEHKKTNTPLYAETVDKLNALDEDYREVKQLQEYNEKAGALPTGFQKWNVNWDTGDLRVKALATPEAQAYVKIISRMLNKAKDFYPGRVTNFDLNQFKQQFPTLANSPEGRNLIAEQLVLANRIAYLKDETLKSAIDHYGSGADPTQIRRYATENYRKLKGQLESELKEKNKKAVDLIEQQNVEQRPSLDEIFK